jgi:hypothetical protein
MFRRCALGLAIAAGLGSVPFSTSVHAQSCAQELARQDAALRQFEGDARRESIEFALDDARRAALAEVNKRLQGDATAEAAKEIKARWDEYRAYVDQGRTLQAITQNLSRCLQGGQGQCLEEIRESVRRNLEAGRLARRIGDAVQQWIDALGNEAISRAVGRVDRARDILQNFTNRAAGSATEAATQGIESCLRDFDQRVLRAQTANPPVDPRQPPPPGGSVAAPRKGGSGGRTAALIGIPAAAAVGLGLYAKNAIDSANASADGGSPGGSSNGSTTIRLLNNPPIQCTRVGGSSLQSLCVSTTDVMIDVGNTFPVGTQVCILTEPSSFPDCRTRTASSQINFRIEERIVNIDLNGNITGCRPPQTGIFVYRDTFVGVQPTTRLAANLPVSCS